MEREEGSRVQSCAERALQGDRLGRIALAPHLRLPSFSQCKGFLCSLQPCPGKPWPGCQSPQLIAASF